MLNLTASNALPQTISTDVYLKNNNNKKNEKLKNRNVLSKNVCVHIFKVMQKSAAGV